MAHRRTGKKIHREPGTFYYFDGAGNMHAKRAKSKGPARRTGVKVERTTPGSMLFVDKHGNICEAERKKGRRRR